MIAIDTNLLVYAHLADSPRSDGAGRALLRAQKEARGWGLPTPVLAEFWKVVTAPPYNEREGWDGPRCAHFASLFLDSLFRAGAQCWRPAAGFCTRFPHAAVTQKVRGMRIFDLQIALVALDNGAHEIWSADREFATVPGLRLVNPLSE